MQKSQSLVHKGNTAACYSFSVCFCVSVLSTVCLLEDYVSRILSWLFRVWLSVIVQLNAWKTSDLLCFKCDVKL